MLHTERSPFSPSVPERIGRYEILLPIGTGGMATVYLARTRVVGDLYREVALKLMHPHLRTEDGSWAIQLVEEAKLAASIRHPNVVPVLEVGDADEGVYLVMEYVEGDTLSGVIRAARSQKTRLPPPIVARILADGLTGLHAAHELRGPGGEPLHLVHRDFSPQNVLVGTDGISRLTDFGIAKVKTRIGVTASGVIKGKIGYMAPEQALGRPLDRRSDVWSAGVVAWELLALRRLYQEDDQVATLLRLVSNTPPRIRSVCPDLPREVDEVIASALEVDPARRCASALELRRSLLAAWRHVSPVADAAEVAEFVRGLVSSKLGKRKEQADAVLALRAKLSHVSERAIAMASHDGFDSSSSSAAAVSSGAVGRASEQETEAPTSRLPAKAGAAGETEATTDQSSSWARSRPASRWKRPAAGATLAVVGALAVGGVFLWRARLIGADPGANSGDATSIASGSEGVSPARDSSGLVDALVAPPLAEPRQVLVVRSDVPMSSLQVGTRALALVTPTREVDVQLAAEERGSELTITASAPDGRRASARVDAADAALELHFPTPTKVKPPSTAKPTGKKPPGLAPTPYDK